MYLLYYSALQILHTFSVCRAGDMHTLSVTKQSLDDDLNLLVELKNGGNLKRDAVRFSF